MWSITQYNREPEEQNTKKWEWIQSTIHEEQKLEEIVWGSPKNLWKK